MEPNGNTSGALCVIDEIPVMSWASAWPISTNVSWKLDASTVWSCGIDSPGFVVSTIVIVWVVICELPDASVAVQVTVVSPIGKTSGAVM